MPPNPDYQMVCAYLKSLNIHFCEKWVTESISDLKTRNPGVSTNDLRKGVYEKWLSTNLRDFRIGSLPSNILSYGKITLSGTYAVQVESMVNSARSCYSELQKLENPGKCDDTTVKSDEDTNSKRCLTFLLCDGVQEVQGMEYHFIPSIRLNDPNFLPGFKMIVKGPVACRKGMLLLKQENVKVYGGKVDDLCETNNIVRLLRTRLGLSANNNENNTNQETVRNDSNGHSATLNVQPRELPAAHNNDPGDTMEMDELLSQNDDILLNLSFDPAFENEYNQNHSRQEVQIEENCFQMPKKPRINICDEFDWEENNTNQVVNSPCNMYPNITESCNYMSNKKAKLEREQSHSRNSSSSNNSNEVIPSTQHPFNDDDDIIIEDDSMFQSHCVQKKTGSQNSVQGSWKCTQMKMSSYLTKCTKSSTPPISAGASSNCTQEQPPKKIMSYPFVYLKQITAISVTKPTTFTVKAIILTLKSKISIKNDEFALKACISDGSSTIEVNFSSQTLENILGYSPCELTSMMSEKNRNSAVGDRLKGIFFSAQQKLLSMNCLMEIQFFRDGSTPLVVGLEEIRPEHVNALKARSC